MGLQWHASQSLSQCLSSSSVVLVDQVGSLSNHTHTHTRCFSTHLTRFTDGFSVLPKPVNWNYVFANADLLKNMTIYLTVIVASLLYIILLIYTRHHDRKDLQKVIR